MVKGTTITGLYKEYLDTDNLIEIIIGAFEINYIFQNSENTVGKKYNLIMDYETKVLLEFLCHSWTNKIRATIFKSAIEEWIKTGKLPFHIIPKKDYEKYVRENSLLRN